MVFSFASRFLDERKNNNIRQNKRREKQKKLHQSQLEDISKYISDNVTIYTNEELEQKIANKDESYV